MKEHKLKIRARLVIIKNNKILLTYTKDGNFYFFIGGKMEFGETLLQTCCREIKEECGEEVNFSLKKILYIRDFIKLDINEHSVEFYILGDINKYKEVEDRVDHEYPTSHHQTWEDMENLPKNILPKSLIKRLLKDYLKGFPVQGVYLGEIE